MKKFTIYTLICVALCGCGYIKKPFVSNESLLDKAEMATGIDQSNLRIVQDSVVSEVDSVHFKVKDNKGNTYRCYFTSIVAVDSDAVCTKLGANGNETQKCNAVYKAAGKC